MDVRFPKIMGRKSDAIITVWHADNGQHVADGDRLFDYETSKMSASFNSPASGTLTQMIPAGDPVKYDEVVARITDE